MSDVLIRIRSLPSWQVTLAGALLVLGFLIAAQLAADSRKWGEVARRIHLGLD